MDLSATEQAVMHRFAQKTHIAGGAKAGYVLRRVAIAAGLEGDADVDASVTSLTDRGLVAVSEDGAFVYLTQEGVEALAPADAVSA